MEKQKKILTNFVAVTALLGAVSANALLYDVNDIATNNTQAGWTAVDLNGINGVTFTAIGGITLDDRDRGLGNTDGAGGDTANNDMWRDFIFADERFATPDAVAGVDVLINGLLANENYDVLLWAFDDSSNGDRNMTWNGNALNLPNSPDPTSLSDQMVSFQALSDGAGNLVLEGRIGSPQGTCCNVFVNGFELTASNVPEPSSVVLLGLGLAGLIVTRRKKQS